jgi:hypothetical protein
MHQVSGEEGRNLGVGMCGDVGGAGHDKQRRLQMAGGTIIERLGIGGC